MKRLFEKQTRKNFAMGICWAIISIIIGTIIFTIVNGDKSIPLAGAILMAIFGGVIWSSIAIVVVGTIFVAILYLLQEKLFKK